MFCQREDFDQICQFRYLVEFGWFVKELVLNSFANLDFFFEFGIFCQRDWDEQFWKFRYFVESGFFIKEMVLNSFGKLEILSKLNVLSKWWFWTVSEI